MLGHCSRPATTEPTESCSRVQAQGRTRFPGNYDHLTVGRTVREGVDRQMQSVTDTTGADRCGSLMRGA